MAGKRHLRALINHLENRFSPKAFAFEGDSWSVLLDTFPIFVVFFHFPQ